MPRLIWVFAGRTLILLVLSYRGSYVDYKSGRPVLQIRMGIRAVWSQTTHYMIRLQLSYKTHICRWKDKRFPFILTELSHIKTEILEKKSLTRTGIQKCSAPLEEWQDHQVWQLISQPLCLQADKFCHQQKCVISRPLAQWQNRFYIFCCLSFTSISQPSFPFLIKYLDRYSYFLYRKLKMMSYMSRNMTKPTKWVCAQRRLRSACASAQSDQSLHCPHEETLGP